MEKTHAETSIGREEGGVAAAATSLQQRASLWARYRRLPRNVWAISLVSLLNDASSEMIYPLLPLFLSLTLGASPAAIGAIEGTAESISSLLKLFAGHFSDRLGKRKGLIVFGYALAALSRPLLALASNWYQVFGIRFSDRVGKGIRSAPRDAMIADAAPVGERGIAFGFHRAMDHLGAVIGPLLSLLALSFIAARMAQPSAADYRKVFLLASIPGLAAVFVAAFVVRETSPAATEAKKKRGAVIGDEKFPRGEDAARFSLQGFDGNFKRFLVIVALFTLSNSSDAFLILRAQEAGVSVALVPLLWSALHISRVISSLVGGDLSDRLGRKALIVAGWTLYAAVYAGFAFVTTATGVWTLFLIYGIYSGLAEGTEKALVADLVPAPQQRGAAFGLYNLAFGVTVLPASLLMGALWNWRGPQLAFLVSAATGACAAALLLITVKGHPVRKHG